MEQAQACKPPQGDDAMPDLKKVKFKEKASLESNSGLIRYCSTENVSQAYLVTKQDTNFDLAKRPGSDTQFLNVPAHILCYLLGQAERLLWE